MNATASEPTDGADAGVKSPAGAGGQTIDDPRVIRALEEYRRALDAGKRVDRREFLERQPEIAGVLAGCLAALEFVHSAAPGLSRAGQDQAPANGDSTDQATGTLGDFRVVREIGRGGMGIVYEAEQISLGLRVALKVLPFAAALDSKQLQRFKNEAQAAAQLHHTNIVPVFGVGTERGVHYYAMQYIEGRTLAGVIADLRQRERGGPAPPERAGSRAGAAAPAPPAVQQPEPDATGAYPGTKSAAPGKTGSAETIAATVPAAAAGISTERSSRSPAFFRTAASLAIQAAEALEHAHQLGVIHRDIKPANMLVDVRGNLWITDFGLAHCQSQAGLTMTGDLVGTLRYMSPEQALAKRVTIDHRTDIYSLGATLYELLTLEPAFHGSDRQELLRQIAFEEPPPLRRLNLAMPRELETIVLKALEKNPAERYAAAQDMADDLRRYLEDKPIRARRPTLLFRARKWTRRHRGGVAATVVSTMLALAVGLVLMAWQWRVAEDRRMRAVKAEAAAKKAEEETRKAAAQLKVLNVFLIDDLLGQASPFKNPVGAHITVRELLDKAARQIDENKGVAAEPHVEATIRHTIGHVYCKLALFDKAERHIRRALEIRQRVLGWKHRETLATRALLGDSLFRCGECADAEKVLRETLTDLREALGGEDEETLSAMRKLADALLAQGKVDEGQRLRCECYEVTRKTRPADDLQTLDARSALLNVLLIEGGRLDDAEALFKQNVDAHRRAGRADDDGAVVADLLYGPILLAARGKWNEAERQFRDLDNTYRRVLGPEADGTITNQDNLAALLHARGKWKEAESLFRNAVGLHRKVYHPKDPWLALVLYAWGSFLLDKGDFEEAELVLQEALQIQRQAVIKGYWATGQMLSALGWALTRTGRAKEGEPLLREGLDICRRKLPKKDWFTADTESRLGGCLLEQRQYDQAEPFLLDGYRGLLAAAGSPPITDSWPIRILEGLHDSPGVPPDRIRQALERMIALYEAWGKPDRAAQWRSKRKAVEKNSGSDK
jgi:serine/threonine protein kinase/Tfp pilus assembly protein PilF